MSKNDILRFTNILAKQCDPSVKGKPSEALPTYKPTHVNGGFLEKRDQFCEKP